MSTVGSVFTTAARSTRLYLGPYGVQPLQTRTLRDALGRVATGTSSTARSVLVRAARWCWPGCGQKKEGACRQPLRAIPPGLAAFSKSRRLNEKLLIYDFTTLGFCKCNM